MGKICKNCSEDINEHLEAKRKFTDEEILVCPSTIFGSKKTTLFEEDSPKP